MKKILTYILPKSYWVYLLFILIESILPQDPQNNLSHHKVLIRGDYLVHFGIFLCVYVGYIILIQLKHPPFRTDILRKIFISAAFVAVFSEILQLFTTTRTFNWYDMLSNFTGIFLGNLLLILYLKQNSAPQPIH